MSSRPAKPHSRSWSSSTAKVREVPPVVLAVATFGFIGLSPVAPGTMGSLAAAALYSLIPGLQNGWALAAGVLLLLVAGAASARIVELRTGEQDPGFVVIDEALGQWLALMTFSHQGEPIFVVTAFAFFRILDVWKPYPAKLFERLGGGAGVVLDDVVAGLYACVAANLAVSLLAEG
jgi:phosphatidylglycerophosphatase A